MNQIPENFVTLGGLLGLLYGVIHGSLTVKRQFKRNGLRVPAETYLSDMQATERRLEAVERRLEAGERTSRDVRADVQDLQERVRPLELTWERVERLLEFMNKKLARISDQLEPRKDA